MKTRLNSGFITIVMLFMCLCANAQQPDHVCIHGCLHSVLPECQISALEPLSDGSVLVSGIYLEIPTQQQNEEELERILAQKPNEKPLAHRHYRHFLTARVKNCQVVWKRIMNDHYYGKSFFYSDSIGFALTQPNPEMSYMRVGNDSVMMYMFNMNDGRILKSERIIMDTITGLGFADFWMLNKQLYVIHGKSRINVTNSSRASLLLPEQMSKRILTVFDPYTRQYVYEVFKHSGLNKVVLFGTYPISIGSEHKPGSNPKPFILVHDKFGKAYGKFLLDEDIYVADMLVHNDYLIAIGHTTKPLSQVSLWYSVFRFEDVSGKPYLKVLSNERFPIAKTDTIGEMRPSLVAGLGSEVFVLWNKAIFGISPKSSEIRRVTSQALKEHIPHSLRLSAPINFNKSTVSNQNGWIRFWPWMLFVLLLLVLGVWLWWRIAKKKYTSLNQLNGFSGRTGKMKSNKDFFSSQIPTSTHKQLLQLVPSIDSDERYTLFFERFCSLDLDFDAEKQYLTQMPDKFKTQFEKTLLKECSSSPVLLTAWYDELSEEGKDCCFKLISDLVTEKDPWLLMVMPTTVKSRIISELLFVQLSHEERLAFYDYLNEEQRQEVWDCLKVLNKADLLSKLSACSLVLQGKIIRHIYMMEDGFTLDEKLLYYDSLSNEQQAETKKQFKKSMTFGKLFSYVSENPKQFRSFMLEQLYEFANGDLISLLLIKSAFPDEANKIVREIVHAADLKFLESNQQSLLQGVDEAVQNLFQKRVENLRKRRVDISFG